MLLSFAKTNKQFFREHFSYWFLHSNTVSTPNSTVPTPNPTAANQTTVPTPDPTETN